MKPTRTVATLAATLITFGSLAGGANGAVLTFDISGATNFTNMDQNYGDRITTTSSGLFSYGSSEGFTPNVVVSYGNSDPAFWSTGYGNLQNVLFDDADVSGFLTITLTADPGFYVRLHSFNVAAFGAPNRTIDLVGVGNAPLSNSFFGEVDSLISASSSTFYNFTTPLQASELIITIDSRNLGSSNDDIAIDNITFSQVAIPEPSSILLLGLSVLGFATRRKRTA